MSPVNFPTNFTMFISVMLATLLHYIKNKTFGGNIDRINECSF